MPGGVQQTPDTAFGGIFRRENTASSLHAHDEDDEDDEDEDES